MDINGQTFPVNLRGTTSVKGEDMICFTYMLNKPCKGAAYF